MGSIHDWEQAILSAEEGLLQTPGSAPLHALLAQLFAEQNMHAQARHHYEAARAYAPETLSYTLALIDDYLRTGEATQALVYLQDVLAAPIAAENVSAVLWRLGQTFFVLGRWQDALLAFSELLVQQEESADQAPPLTLIMAYVLEILIYQGHYQRAAQILLQFPQDLFNTALTQRYQARVAYWAGNFVQAREAWRAMLMQDFDEDAFGALHFLGPPVMQSEADAHKWNQYLLEAADLFQERPVLTGAQDYTLFNPFDFALNHDAQESMRLAQWGAWYQRHFTSLTPSSSSDKKPVSRHIGVVIDGFQPMTLAFVLPWLKHYQAVCPDYQLTLFYQVGDDMPEALLDYQALLYQLPMHTSAALQVFARAELSHLLYASLRGSLYRLAMTPPAGIQQYLFPLFQYASGLPQLRQDLVQALIAARLYWSEAPVPSHAFDRRQLGLPALGNLYCFAMDPFGWTPQMDAWAEAILQHDRKAFIVGLTLPESTWHLRVQQRHEECLSRPQRVRWISPEQFDKGLNVMDWVLGTDRPESAFMLGHAARRGVPIAYIQNETQETPFSAALRDQAAHCLHTDPISLAKFLTAPTGHVRLENTSFSAPNPHDLAAWDAILLSLEASL